MKSLLLPSSNPKTTVCNQNPMMTSFIPGQTRQPGTMPLWTFWNAWKRRKSAAALGWTKVCPACLFQKGGPGPGWAFGPRCNGRRHAAVHGWWEIAALQAQGGASVSACPRSQVSLNMGITTCWYWSNPGIPYSWTVEELRAVIGLLKQPEFNPADIDSDLHKRISTAVNDKMIESFNMREGSLDGDEESWRIWPCLYWRWRKSWGKLWRTHASKGTSTTDSRWRLTLMAGSGWRRGGQYWCCLSDRTTQVYHTDIPYVTMGYTVDIPHFLQGGWRHCVPSHRDIYWWQLHQEQDCSQTSLHHCAQLNSTVSGKSLAWRALGMLLLRPFFEEKGHCRSMECLTRPAPSQIASCTHETRGGLRQ